MKTIVILFILFSNNIFSQIQIKKVLEIEEKSKLLYYFPDKGNGFVVITGRSFGSKNNLTRNLKYFTPELNEVWDLKIQNHYKNSGYSVQVIYSQFTDFFYLVQRTDSKKKISESYITNPSYIMQIDYKGNMRSLEYKDFIKEDEHQLAVLITKNYLNIISRNENKVYLNRISHSDFSFKRIELPLLGVFSEGTYSCASFWHYEGNTEDKIFFSKKVYGGYNDQNNMTYNFTIASINEEGLLLDSIYLNAYSPEFFPLSSFYDNNEGAWECSLYNINTFLSSNGPVTRIYVHSVGDISFDFQNQSIFVYGMMDRKYIKPFKPLQKNPDGFYLEKFDFNGEKKWQIVKDFDKTFSDSIANEPQYRHIKYAKNNLYIDGNYKMQFVENSYKISDSGEIIDSQSSIDIKDNSLKKPVNVYYNGLNIEYNRNYPERNRTIKILSMGNRDILFDLDPVKNSLEVLSFPDK